MKSYLELIPISAKVHRKQNKMTIICIILSVFLVTAIFSMADMEIRHQKIKVLNMYGNWHVMLSDVEDGKAELIKSRPDVEFMADYGAINNKIDEEFYIGGKKAALCGAEEIIEGIIGSVTKGEYPKKGGEIMLSPNAEKSLNINVGDSVTVETPFGDFEYTVSGFGAGNGAEEKYDAVTAFMTLEAFDKINELRGGGKNDRVRYIRFKGRTNVRKAIGDIKERYSLTDENVSENTYLLGVTGFGKGSYMTGMYLVAAILFVLVLMAGVLMIAVSLNSNVSERTGFFGMLRCIGASKKQVMRFVRLEALNWCKTAVPIGIVLGIAVTWGLCAFLLLMAGSYYREMPQMQISAVGVVSGILSEVSAVLLAAQSPAKKAAKAEPVSAASGNAVNIKKVRRAANTRFIKIETALGIHHAVSEKKSFVLMSFSFALSIILFLSFSAFIGYVKNAAIPLQEYRPDISISSGDSTRSLKRSLISEISGRECVKRVFGRSMKLNIPIKPGGKINVVSYDEYQFDMAENYIIEGDPERARGGRGFVLTVYRADNPLKVGDKIELEGGEAEVAAILSDCPFESEKGTQTVICSEEVFEKLIGKSGYSVIDIQLTKKADDEVVNGLYDLAEGNVVFSDRRSVNRNARGGFLAIVLFVYGFLAIIALITVFNIMNSISMSVSARIRQYGAMRAVGMDAKQITRMIAAEAGTYAFFGCAVGCAIGMMLHKLIFELLITSYFGDGWQIPLIPTGVILLLAALSCAAAVYAPSKRIKNMAITDTIKAQ